MVRHARTKTGAFSAGSAAPLPNDYGSLVTARYRYQVLQDAVDRHPAIELMLDNMTSSGLSKLFGYGRTGIGPGSIYLLFALRDTADLFSLLDPSGEITTDTELLSLLSKRYRQALPNPLADAEVNTNTGMLKYPPKEAQAAAGRLGNELLKIPKASFKNDAPTVQAVITAFAVRLKESVPRGARWEEGVVRFAKPMMRYFLDLHTLNSLDASVELDDSATPLDGPEDVKPNIRKSSRRSHAVGKTHVATLFREIHRFSTDWLVQLGKALSVTVPLVWSDDSRAPLSPPRSLWSDPFLVLLALRPDARERLKDDPFGPIGGVRMRFERIPTCAFGDTAKDASAIRDLAEVAWSSRESLLLELQAAAAAALALSESERADLLATSARSTALKLLEPGLLTFTFPSLLRQPIAAIEPQLRRSFAIFYPAHHAFLAAAGRILSVPELEGEVSLVDGDLLVDLETGLCPAERRAEKEQAEAEQDADAGAACGDDDEVAKDGEREAEDVEAGAGGDELRPGEDNGEQGIKSVETASKEKAKTYPEQQSVGKEGKKGGGKDGRLGEDDEDEEHEDGGDGQEGANGGVEKKGDRKRPADDEPPAFAPPKKRARGKKASGVLATVAGHVLRYIGSNAQASAPDSDAFVFHVEQAGPAGDIVNLVKRTKPVFFLLDTRGEVSQLTFGYMNAKAAAPFRQIRTKLLAKKSLASTMTIQPCEARQSPLPSSDSALAGRIFFALAILKNPAFQPASYPDRAARKVLAMGCSPEAYSKAVVAFLAADPETENRRTALLDGHDFTPGDEELKQVEEVERRLAEGWGRWLAAMEILDECLDGKVDAAQVEEAEADGEDDMDPDVAELLAGIE